MYPLTFTDPRCIIAGMKKNRSVPIPDVSAVINLISAVKTIVKTDVRMIEIINSLGDESVLKAIGDVIVRNRQEKK